MNMRLVDKLFYNKLNQVLDNPTGWNKETGGAAGHIIIQYHSPTYTNSIGERISFTVDGMTCSLYVNGIRMQSKSFTILSVMFCKKLSAHWTIRNKILDMKSTVNKNEQIDWESSLLKSMRGAINDRDERVI